MLFPTFWLDFLALEKSNENITWLNFLYLIKYLYLASLL